MNVSELFERLEALEFGVFVVSADGTIDLGAHTRSCTRLLGAGELAGFGPADFGVDAGVGGVVEVGGRSVELRPVEVDGHAVEGQAWSVRDVTDRVQAELRADQATSVLEAICQALDDAGVQELIRGSATPRLELPEDGPAGLEPSADSDVADTEDRDAVEAEGREPAEADAAAAEASPAPDAEPPPSDRFDAAAEAEAAPLDVADGDAELDEAVGAEAAPLDVADGDAELDEAAEAEAAPLDVADGDAELDEAAGAETGETDASEVEPERAAPHVSTGAAAADAEATGAAEEEPGAAQGVDATEAESADEEVAGLAAADGVPPEAPADSVPAEALDPEATVEAPMPPELLVAAPAPTEEHTDAEALPELAPPTWRDVLEPLAQLVADLGARHGRTVELRFDGVDAPIDFERADEVVGTLPSVMENAIRHGIEPDDERGPKASPSVLRITLTEDREGTTIRVDDDGRGIDLGELSERVVGRGILSADQLRALRAHERLALVCVDGVGFGGGAHPSLAAVRQRLRPSGTRLEIRTARGRGTSVSYVIPSAHA